MGTNGTATSALAYGGESGPPFLAITESWNGTNWTEVNDLNTARDKLAGAGEDNTNGLAIGGTNPGIVAITELWNGTNWTEQNDLSTATRQQAAAGTVSNALQFGGANPGTNSSTITEEWTGAGAPVGAWSTGGSLNLARKYMGSNGTQSSALTY